MSTIIEQKTITVSKKRQITIPVKFYEALGIETEVECVFNGEEIIIRPYKKEQGYFAQEILNELVDKGYEGEALKKEFGRLSKSVKPAIKELLKDVSKFAQESSKNYVDETEDIFGTE